MLDILVAPHPTLKKIAEPVGEVTAAETKFLDQMLLTMYGANGIGLAAPQVGISRRMLVMDIALRAEDGANPIKMVDPEIIWSSEDEGDYDEGCLSFPGQFAPVTRPLSVHVKYLDHEGAERLLEADGLLAVCVQHEIDHLNGITFVDHISRLKREMIMRKLAKAQKSDS